jgi:hypothetical protein
MSPSIVKKVLAGITVVSALASVVAGREAPAIVEPAKPKLDTRLQVKDELDLGRLEAARTGEDSKVDPFAPRSFGSAAAPQASGPGAGPAARQAPALPFRYIGRMIDNGQLAVFLQKGDESYTAMEGERVGDYRIDKITESEIRFTYLPMKTKQTLPL